MNWNSTSGSAPWRRVKWLLIAPFCLLAHATPETSADEEFLAFLGGWQDATGESSTPLEWHLLLEDTGAMNDGHDEQPAVEGVHDDAEQ